MFKKLAVIRSDNDCSCPFGLSNIPKVCVSVGAAIDLMIPIEDVEEKDIGKTKKHNKIIYLTQKTDLNCPYADQVLDNFNSVNCDFDDNGAREKSTNLPSSPLYPRIFYNHGLVPADKVEKSYDPRHYYYSPEERYIDVPFGLFSIFSNRINELNLIKVAEKYTNNFINIQDKLALLRKKYFNTLRSIIPSSSVIKLNEEQLGGLLIAINDWIK